VGNANRRARNEAMMLELLKTRLPLATQEHIRRSRDAVRTCMRLMTNSAFPPDQHAMVHGALTKVLHGERAAD